MTLIKQWFGGALCFAGLLCLSSGCTTRALWENGDLEAVKQPANNANLSLFDVKQKNDLLVVYDEYSERSDKVRTRAYLLNQNQARVNQRRAPCFVNTNLIHDSLPVPLFYSIPNETNSPQTIYAVVATNQQSFTLYSANHVIGSHSLPVYDDGWGKFETVILTPVAVTLDLTIVGGVLGYSYFTRNSETESSPVNH